MLGRPKNRRKQQKTERRRWKPPTINWRRYGTIGLSVLIVAGAVSVVRWALDQPVETTSLEGRFQRVSPAAVERAVKRKVYGAGLVSVDLEEVRQEVDAIPWVDTVSVARTWPRGLKVTVIEHMPAARWGERGLLNTRGELFVTDARHIPPELPQLSGPPGTESVVARRYLAAQGRLIENGMRLAAMRLDERGAWELDLDNGVTVRLGRRQVNERFETFMTTALKLIARRSADISYVDMRYTNGFAVGWRSGSSRRTETEEERRDV